MLLVTTQVVVLQTRPYIIHQALARECYPGGGGRGLQLANTCCRMHNYTGQNVTTCAERIRAAAAHNPRYAIKTQATVGALSYSKSICMKFSKVWQILNTHACREKL